MNLLRSLRQMKEVGIGSDVPATFRGVALNCVFGGSGSPPSFPLSPPCYLHVRMQSGFWHKKKKERKFTSFSQPHHVTARGARGGDEERARRADARSRFS